MESKFAPELIEKAKAAKSPAELLTLAKESEIELAEEEAANYFAKLNPQSGDIADEELKNVAGGGCHNGDGRLIVTKYNSCDYWLCLDCSHELHICDYCDYRGRSGGWMVCENANNHA